MRLKARHRLLKNFCFALLSSLLTFTLSVNTSFADANLFSLYTWEISNTKPVFMVAGYEGKNLGVTITDANPDDINFFLYFHNSIDSNLFTNGSRRPLARIKIFKNAIPPSLGGNYGDVWLDSPGTQYNGSTPISSIATAYTNSVDGPNGNRVSLSSCNPKTWMDSSASRNFIVFQISRNCAGIGDGFYAVAYIDSDASNGVEPFSNGVDYKYVPERAVYFDIKSVARAPKKDQIVTFSPQSNVLISASQIIVNATSSANLPINYSTATPSICAFTSATSTTLKILNTGKCSIDAVASGNGLYNDSARVFLSFNINPIKVSQVVTINQLQSVAINDVKALVVVSSSTSGTVPTLSVPSTKTVCNFQDSQNPKTLTLLSAGTCTVEAKVPESELYLGSAIASMTFTVTFNKGVQNLSVSKVETTSLDLKQLNLLYSSSSGVIPFFSTPNSSNVCRFLNSSNPATLSLLNSGTCVVEGYLPETNLFLPSQKVLISFEILPVKKNQQIYFNRPEKTNVGTTVLLDIYSDAALPITLESTTPNICRFLNSYSPKEITFVSTGTCGITVSQSGNSIFNPTGNLQTTLLVTQAEKPTPTPTKKSTPTPTPTPTKKSTPTPKKTIVITTTSTAKPKASALPSTSSCPKIGSCTKK